MRPVCPYCNNPAKLVDSSVVYGRSYGMIWLCKPCDAYVGVHKSSATHMPLGTLANRATREARKRAHAAFDPLWKSRRLNRSYAYQLLSEFLGIDGKDTHIGNFTVEQCERVVVFATNYEDASHGGEPDALESWAREIAAD